MRDVLQEIVFPREEKYRNHHSLYYRKDRGYLYDEDGDTHLVISPFTYCEFNTYFNGFSNAKWKEYTGASDVKLHLRLKGKFKIRLAGYSMPFSHAVKTVFEELEYDLNDFEELIFNYPETDEEMLAFEIDSETGCYVYSGYYDAEVPETREINLAISTTTCRKEDYITANAGRIKTELLDSDEELRKHLWMHIVDNGRTLNSEDLPNDNRIILHPNKNTGGAGGFARGMMECLHQEDPITHILLMDDDVDISTSAIKKTYKVLKHALPECRKYFVSGAMLSMENPTFQKEDVGTVHKNGTFVPLKGALRQGNLHDNLLNEREYPLPKQCYAAWWFCCIPLDTIRENGLPLPIFVRGDDVEYGLRCKPGGFITMNGISVWHMGFATKQNIGMDYYQVNRNLFIDQATTGVLEGVNVFAKEKGNFRKFLYSFDYKSAEITLKAFEDFLKGPEFIKEDRGEEILFANNKAGNKMVPMSELGNPDVKYGDPEKKLKNHKFRNKLYKLTINGQRYWPFGNRRGSEAIPPINKRYLPSRMEFKNKFVVVEKANRTGYILEKDQKKFNELMGRFKKAERYYSKHKEEIEKSYADARAELTSEEFWKKYLEIDFD